jgi:chromosome segregation ATPase
MKEESSEKHVRDMQQQLQESYGTIESLIQAKEKLRHSHLRLRLRLNGMGTHSLPTIVQKLSEEAEKLNTELSQLTFNYKTKADHHDSLGKQHEQAQKTIDVLKEELTKRTNEYRALTDTFERHLQGRLRKSTRK